LRTALHLIIAIHTAESLAEILHWMGSGDVIACRLGCEGPAEIFIDLSPWSGTLFTEVPIGGGSDHSLGAFCRTAPRTT